MGPFLFAFMVFAFVMGMMYMVFVTARRKQQNAMQKHLLDKFSSTQDFTEFIQSPAGQKYVAGFSEAVAKPGASILTSVRVGVVLIFLGFAFFMIRPTPDAHEGPYVLRGVGTLVSMLGVGFLVSGLASYLIAKRIKSEQAD